MGLGAKIRLLSKWTLPAMAVVLTGLWIVCGFGGVGFIYYGATHVGGVGWERGICFLHGASTINLAPTGFEWQSKISWSNAAAFRTDWRFTFGTERFFIVVPGWILPILPAVAASLLFWSDRGKRRLAVAGNCPHCSFSLAGLAPDAKCPECGKARDQKQKTPSQ